GLGGPVIAGGVLSTSKAPTSHAGPGGRVMPRWSTPFTGAAAQPVLVPASIAGLPASNARFSVEPPLNFGEVSKSGFAAAPPQLVSVEIDVVKLAGGNAQLVRPAMEAVVLFA